MVENLLELRAEKGVPLIVLTSVRELTEMVENLLELRAEKGVPLIVLTSNTVVETWMPWKVEASTCRAAIMLLSSMLTVEMAGSQDHSVRLERLEVVATGMPLRRSSEVEAPPALVRRFPSRYIPRVLMLDMNASSASMIWVERKKILALRILAC